MATTYDLTTANTQLVDTDNVLGGALFVTETQNPTGTGVYDTFLIIQDKPTEDGFNTDFRPAPLDDGNSPFTHSITLGDIPTVTKDSIEYYVFRLDINEPNSSTAPISITSLQIYSAGANNGSIGSLADLQAQNLVYDLDASSDVTINLKDINSGSGQGDLFFYVPVDKFAGIDPAENIYLYSGFSSANAGFEEWSLVGNDQPPPPPPPTPTAELAIDKLTNGADDGGTILVGENVTWTYVVNNVGDGAVSNVVVVDDNGTAGNTSDDFFATYAGGDSNSNGKLDVGETWTFTYTGEATAGTYVNTGTANGNGPVNGVDTPLSANDLSGYFGADPQIAINKVTVDDGSEGDGKTILTGEAISWKYTITNAGNVALSNVIVTDSDAGVTPTAVLGADLVHNIGDTDNDGELDLAEAWIYSASGTAITGAYSNTGTAKGSFTDSAGHTRTDTETDGSSYTGANPQIAINKVTTGSTGVGGDGVLNSNDDITVTGDGISILAGSNVTWTFTVTNAGNVGLSNVQVSDDKLGDIDANINTVLVKTGGNQDNVLDVGETWTYKLAGTAIAGSYSNTGSASGSFTDTAGHVGTDTATDVSSYTGTFTEAQAGRTQGFWGNHTEAWDGSTSNNSKWQKLVGTDLSVAEVNPNKTTHIVKLNGQDVTVKAGDVLLGDTNHDGDITGDEVGLLVTNDVAKAILSSKVQGDHRISFLQQAISAQLNIDNHDVNPGDPWSPANSTDKLAGDLITEAVQWLKAYGGSAFSDSVLNSTDYNTANSKFVVALTNAQDSSFWSTSRDVDGTAANTQATGEDLKNVLEAFNKNLLVTSASDQIGWNTASDAEHVVNVVGVQVNSADAFWDIVHDNLGTWHG